MKQLIEELQGLLPLDQLESMSGEEVVGSVAMDLYRAEFATIRKCGPEIPQILREMILLIELDTELSMNGIAGYLENSSGQFISETTAVLQRIGNETDAEIMQSIQDILSANGVSVAQLRENVNGLSEGEVTNSLEVHGQQVHEVMQQVQHVAEGLLMQSDNEEVFEMLYQYVDANMDSLKQQLEQLLSE